MLSKKLFEKVKERDGGFCLYVLPGCMGEGTVLDHRANRGAGGSPILDHPANLTLCCGACNGAKADAHALVLANLEQRGLWVPKAATNEATLERAKGSPVEYLDGERYYLIDASTRVHESEVGGPVPF